MLVDSHCHLDFPDFKAELDAVVSRAKAVGVGRFVTISTRVRREDNLIAIAERLPEVFCSVGTHPHHAHEELDIGTADLVARTGHPKVVAIGEAGLDYHYDNSPRDAQAQGFRTHIAAARATQLPLVIHTREADDDCARILEDEMGKGAFPAVLHCYTGGPELARRAVELGYAPEGRSETHAAAVIAAEPKDGKSPVAEYYQGGTFCAAEYSADFATIKKSK